ncbi:DUF397 domain-containing protein [Streptomyces olivoreticuli]
MSTFRKSSYSSGNESCVEIALSPDLISIRDSKNPNGPALHFTSLAYRLFIRTLTSGELSPIRVAVRQHSS